MKVSRKFWLFVFVALTIVSYLMIEISYNTSSPLYDLIIPYFLSFEWFQINPFDSVSSKGVKLGKLYSQILFSLMFLVFSFFMKSKWWIFFASLLIIFIWLKNYWFYGGIMDEKIYLLSSIFFLITIVLLNFFNFYLSKNSKKLE